MSELDNLVILIRFVDQLFILLHVFLTRRSRSWLTPLRLDLHFVELVTISHLTLVPLHGLLMLVKKRKACHCLFPIDVLVHEKRARLGFVGCCVFQAKDL